MSCLNIETLREFVVLGKSLNYTQAAKNLHLDQSTLSRRIQSLESEVGATLIRRSTRRVELTKAGMAFLEDSINVLGRYDKAIERARDLDGSDVPVVRIGGILIGNASERLLNYTTAFILKERLPVSIEVFEPHTSAHGLTRLSNDDSIDRLRDGSIDIALLYGCEGGDWSGVCHRVLLRDPFVLFVDENHPLAQCGSVRLADIAPYVLRTSVFFAKNNARLEEVFARQGLSAKLESKVIDFTGEWYSSCGKYDAFMFMESCADDVPPQPISGLVRLPVEDEDAYYELWAAWREGDDNSGIPMVLDTLANSASLM